MRALRPSTAVAALTASLALAGSAQAATVTGSVSGGKGYTVIALSRSRIVSLVKLAGNGRFRLPAGRDVTLQLLRSNNTFFGPIVLTHLKGRAYEALSGRTVGLGRIALHAGYAAPVRSTSTKSVDKHVWAYADRAGKPIGAGNLGLLRGRRARVHAPFLGFAGDGGVLPPGGDPTHVGIVTAFNADVTGSGLPNNENPAAATASGNGLFTEMMMPLSMSVNADAAGITPAQVSAIVRSDLRLDFYVDGHQAGGAPVNGVSVDCGTLTYCASGTGTGTEISTSGAPPVGPPPRWGGTVPANPNRPGVYSVQVAPNAGTDAIRPSDVFLVNFHTASGDVVQPTTLTTYFLTVPAVGSYDAGAGPQTISYPAAQTAAGTQGNPVRMSSGQITLHFWRPQRAALPGESGDFYDVGHLHYGIPVTSPGRPMETGCPARFYSNLSSGLSIEQSAQDQTYNQLFPLHDGAADAPANPGNEPSVTLDVAGCAASQGVNTSAPLLLPLTAVDEARQGGTDRAVQSLSVCLPGCDPSAGQPGPGSPQGPGPQGPGPQGPGSQPGAGHPPGPGASRRSR